jgi:tetratricopeptide (TPR) repeat protein
MGQGKGYLTGILIGLLPVLGLAQEEEISFRQADSLTYQQYISGNWKDLTRTGNEALNAGIDYYYLRVRLGVACFERRNYMQAERHFSEALEMNSGDPFAGEYLYGSYLELNRPVNALRVYDQLTPSVKTRLSASLPKLHAAEIAGGILLSNQPDKFDHFDLDGSENYYGETDITRGGTNMNTGLSWRFRNGAAIFGGYTWIRLEKNKLVQTGDTLAADDQYALDQHQFYINCHLPLGKGFSILPAVNLITDNYRVVMPRLNSDSTSYNFPVEDFNLRSWIGYLSVTRDFNIVRTSLFGAWSNFNDREQIQAGFHLMAFPLGNLDFYLSSKLIDHMVDSYHHFIFEQMIGGRILKPIWAEINATFGKMRDYHEQNGYVVYNFTDDMKFKAGAKLIWTISPRTMLTAEYIYLIRQGEYVVYQNRGSEDEPDIVPVTMKEGFNNQIIMLDLTWKF